MSTEIEPTITLTKRRDYWVAIDTETGVGGQGGTREEALSELDYAVALSSGDGDPVEDQASVLAELGIDPDEVEPTEDLPEFFE